MAEIPEGPLQAELRLPPTFTVRPAAAAGYQSSSNQPPPPTLSSTSMRRLCESDRDFAGTGFSKKQAVEVWGALNGVDQTVDVSRFMQVAKDYKVDKSEVELQRMFREMASDGNTTIAKDEFLEAFPNYPVLRQIATEFHEMTKFTVPSSYDYDKHTYQNYLHPGYKVTTEFGLSHKKEYDVEQHGELYGKYKAIRQKVDYSWHGNYTKERQLWQDAIIDQRCLCTEKVVRPWLLFSCGAMGVGKGYVMSWLSKHSILPLEKLVCIDPDYFKQRLPEWDGYTSYDPTKAGTKCHKESGFLQEIAQEVALSNSQHTWIDGSLHDYVWYTQVIDKIRQRYPWYKIALFYVHCSDEKVYERCKKRGEETGRFIPQHLISHAISKTAKSLKILAPQVDMVISLNNESRAPCVDFVNVNMQSMEVIKQLFMDTSIRSCFPESAPALWLERNKTLSDELELPTLQQWVKKHAKVSTALPDEAVLTEKLSEVSLGYRKVSSEGEQWQLQLMFSKPTPITLDAYSRNLAAIPENAEYSLLCYGAYTEQFAAVRCDSAVPKAVGDSNLRQLCENMSFIYLSSDGAIVAVNIIVSAAAGQGKGERRGVLTCSQGVQLGTQWDSLLESEGRWCPQVRPVTCQKHANAVAWIRGGELSDCPSGAFAYRLKDGRTFYYAIAKA